jgi:hypothetical protein
MRCKKLDDGTLVLETPPDPRSSATWIALDPLEWIHRIPAHIPDSGRHCQRFYGAYSSRARILMAPTDGESSGLPASSFEFHLALDTLAVQLAVPLNGSVEDFPSLGHFLGVRPTGRTKKRQEPLRV